MSCSSVDVKAYFLGEVSRAEKSVVDDHLRACESCREELDRLKLTDTALRSLVEEDAPQRIAFVSDKVFEPRWYQTIWRSGPAMGFASSALLAGAILAHGFSLRPPAQPAAAAPVVDTAQIEQRIEREVNVRLEAAAAKQREQMASMLDAVQKSYETKRQADLADVRQAVDYYKNQTARLMVAANRVETPAQ
ncbi:MAG TPA: zf-HC2 domain-containing protein [Bryobacteraceae bacterium]|nr:zf-HC2 domain-containing protein [Bryobacteraceae bacterium]